MLKLLLLNEVMIMVTRACALHSECFGGFSYCFLWLGSLSQGYLISPGHGKYQSLLCRYIPFSMHSDEEQPRDEAVSITFDKLLHLFICEQ